VAQLRIGILGAGGLGSVVGGWLAESGVEVALLARPAHAEAIRARGLEIRGIRGERCVRRHLEAHASPDEVQGRLDFLIVAVKAKDTDAALAGLGGLRERIGAVLSLQNALGKDEVLAAHFGRERTVGAATTESGTLTGPGRVQHVGTAPTSFYFGELGGAPSERVAALVDAFNKAGFGAKAAADIRHVEWEKLLQIASICAFSVSALGTMPGGSVAEAFAVREAAEHYVAIARELLAVYRGMGYAPQDFFAPYSRFCELERETDAQATLATQALGRRMLDAGVVGRPSLHVDLMRGRLTEAEFCLAPFLAEADRLGIAVPTVRACWRIIRTLEQMLA
jgi:2-dehydropantoate 2-reductase